MSILIVSFNIIQNLKSLHITVGNFLVKLDLMRTNVQVDPPHDVSDREVHFTSSTSYCLNKLLNEDEYQEFSFLNMH